MIKFLRNLKILPRWVIIILDLMIIAFSALLGYLLRFNFSIPDLVKNDFLEGVAIYTGLGVVSIFATNSYKGIIRYTGLQDGARIFYMVILNLALVCLTNLLYYYNLRINLIPYYVVFIAFLA